MNIASFTVEEEQEGVRIDKFITQELNSLSRSYLQKVIKNQSLFVNEKPVKASYPVKAGDEIRLEIPAEQEPEILPEEIPLDILYEDSDLLVVNKPKGMVVHPSAGHYTHTLVNAVMFHCHGQLSGINGIMRPGIVHRIDKDTTGALVICKNDIAHRSLAGQLAVHSITRRYIAIAQGYFAEDSFQITGNIGRHPVDRKKMAVLKSGGKTAITNIKVLEKLKGYSLIECRLETGRTHQIRVHLSNIGHPLVGDTVYGSSKPLYPDLQGQTLHAATLGFIHPSTANYMEFTAPTPEYFTKLLNKLR